MPRERADSVCGGVHAGESQPAGAHRLVRQANRRRAGVVSLMLASLLLHAGCGTPTNDSAAPQRESLQHLFYADGPVPPAPDAKELETAAAAVKSANTWERELLEALYPGDIELWAYALRDTDGDGIKDFRVSDFYGRFLEGDTDLDGDGIDNVLDALPFAAAGSDRAALVPAADWAVQGKPASMASLQQAMLTNNRVLLIERSAAFTPALARAVDDVLTRVYRSIFAGKGTLSTLRLVATEESSLLYVDAEEGSGDFAQVLPASGTMEIYRPGIDAPPVIQLGFLVHELGHNIQFEMDFDAERQAEIMRRNVFSADNFHALVARFGWTKVDLEPDPAAEFELYRPQYLSADAYEYRYRGQSMERWAAWLEEIYVEVGEAAYLEDQRLVDAHVLGDYSLSGPWEWYSDHLIAYVYLAMLDVLAERCSAQGFAALREAFQNDVVRAAWPYFRFENARGAAVQDYLAETFPLQPADAAYLAETYLGDLASRHCD